MLIYIFFGILLSCEAIHLPGVPQDFTSHSDAVLSAISDNIAYKFENEYISFLKTGVESASLRQISEQLAKSHSKKDIFTKGVDELSSADQFFLCTTCRATVNIIAKMFREDDGELNGPNNEKVTKEIVLELCKRLNIQTEEVCAGLYDSNWPTCEYIIKKSEMDSRSFCSLFLEFSFCNVKSADYNWTLSINSGGPVIDGPKADVPSSDGEVLTVLHLTDIHYDPFYEPGSLAECEEPLCCQRHKETSEGTIKAAGYWGDFRDCDAPWHMIEDALNHIKATHPHIDYIYQTGDVVDHMVWATSVEKNTDVLSKVSNKLQEMFPDVPVFSCIGNHEPHPLNVFSPVDAEDHLNTRWLYESLYNDWSKWLPSSTETTILQGGYYTHSPKAGFRLIALNNNDCYNNNWWLYHSGENAQPQLKWLHDTLLAAEKANEYVHILAHIPSGDGSCWSVWSREYNKIIERFSNTISGIFNGHSHKDEMNVHYSSKGHAIGISWNGGSLTTFSDKNPNYRLYQIETKTMQVVDHETWIFNLTEANIHGKEIRPVWFKEYTFSSEFTKELCPDCIDKLLDQMAEKPELLRKFWRFKMTSADPRIAAGCNRNCLMSTICRLATTVNDQKTRCDELTIKLAKALDEENTTTASPSSTSTTPTDPTTKRPGNEDDGASALIAMSITTLLILSVIVKNIL
ncbi:sphingomyelin phosphodiesterase 1-like [Teleopsis dalmanni]|uniref:sphingomyelin phosphodiesterase 1-like n=1 Tax=Teleopsis dalmanni TaxID=139649 RepID=UPI0018CD2DA2|nr:sphingomyelin phosphodiesterase 1-like [Teleopsis dalmanni]